MDRFKSVIIIGAPRSGTNMLRDVLTQLPRVGTWPCDEINYIWRHGNVRYPTDEFVPEQARTDVSSYIRKEFKKLAERRGLETIVEKTCANSLRVRFIDQILPDAKYIYIVRDGIDAAASARKRWRAKLDIPYLLRKARYVPSSDLPYYASRYFANRLYRLFSHEQRLAYWGPVISNTQELLKEYTLPEVCALQWQRCVERADEDFSRIVPGRICKVTYETFVASPATELRRIAHFMGYELNDTETEKLVTKVSANSLGKGRKVLGEETVTKLEKLIGQTLQQHGYNSGTDSNKSCA